MLGWRYLVRRALRYLATSSDSPPQSSSAGSSSSGNQSGSWEVVETPELVPVSTSVGSTPGPEHNLIASPELWWHSPAEQVLPDRLFAAASRLRAECELSGAERIELAFQRGQQALRILQGHLFNFVGERCRLRNRCYVVLRSATVVEPFFTWSLPLHQECIRTEPDGSIGHLSVSHGFPSQLEAEAFCFGAGLAGLPRTL